MVVVVNREYNTPGSKRNPNVFTNNPRRRQLKKIIYIRLLASKRRIRPRQIPKMRSRPRQLVRITINTGGKSSFWQAVLELQSNTCAHCSAQFCAQVWRRVVHCSAQFCAQVWRRVVGAVVAASSYIFAWTISWLKFGLSDQLLLVRYPWGKVRYSLFGYLALDLLPE
jgi:hypothetical protein